VVIKKLTMIVNNIHRERGGGELGGGVEVWECFGVGGYD
jgi:hypothetical protein